MPETQEPLSDSELRDRAWWIRRGFAAFFGMDVSLESALQMVG